MEIIAIAQLLGIILSVFLLPIIAVTVKHNDYVVSVGISFEIKAALEKIKRNVPIHNVIKAFDMAAKTKHQLSVCPSARTLRKMVAGYADIYIALIKNGQAPPFNGSGMLVYPSCGARLISRLVPTRIG